MSLTSNCYICSKPAMYTCSFCGKIACDECYDKSKRLCKNCLGRYGKDFFKDNDKDPHEILF